MKYGNSVTKILLKNIEMILYLFSIDFVVPTYGTRFDLYSGPLEKHVL